MATAPEASVSPWKRELVEELKRKFDKYPAVGVLDISGIPAKQFQQIREILRGKAEIKVSRKVLLQLALRKASEEHPGLEDLAERLEGSSALIFTELNPFKLWKLLKENRTSAPAKPGMEAPRDIVIPEGETNFSPGPIVGELQQAGVKARIQAGKVVVLEDSTIAEEGEPIQEEQVGVLSRFGIEPREIGFELRAAYEDGTVFSKDMLEVDEEKTFQDVQNAYMNALRLSFGVKFPTIQTITGMVGQAYSEAHNLALNASIFNSETAPKLLGEASSEMLALGSIIASENPGAIGDELSSMLSVRETAEKSKKEKIGEEKPKEEAVEESEEEAEDKKEEKEEIEEEEPEAGLGGLFE